jgi:hypothetical protein
VLSLFSNHARETREQLLEEGGEDAVEGWDAMAELWESGKIRGMIESDDYSGLPDSVRPNESE